MTHTRPLFAILLTLAVSRSALAGPATAAGASNGPFALTVGPAGITSLKHPNDAFDTDYVAPGRAIGGLVVVCRQPGTAWRTVHTDALRPELKQVDADPAHPAWTAVVRDGDLEITSRYAVQPDGPTAGALWSWTLANRGTAPLQVGDLAIPTPFNTHFGGNDNDAQTDSITAHRAVLTQRQIPHWSVAGHGSFLFLERPNGVGPFLVMVPTGDTRLEMFDVEPARDNRPADTLLYLHSTARAERLATETAQWERQTGDARPAPATRLGHTSVTLAPGGGHADYGFKFRFTSPSAATPYQGVRQVLYEEGKPDVRVVPGMTVPTDLTVRVAIRSKVQVDAVTAEFPAQTAIGQDVVKHPSDTQLYSVRFSHLGENLLTIRSGGQSTVMEFFVTEPLETLIRKRAAFLVSHCQWRGTGKWYDGVFTEWDAVHHVLRSPDDRDRLYKYILTCDDPGLGKAPFLASKNAFMPDQAEVAALDDYIARFVWGGLQMTDREPHPYAIYGIDNWYANRHSEKPGPDGRDHVWRIYDYPHIVLLYYRMHQIAALYPDIHTALSADDYLTRAYRTAMAYFTVPTEVVDWSAYDTGTYNEAIIPDLIDELDRAGRRDDADRLRAHWEQKVKAFVFNPDPYLYGSEYAFDSTTFEGSAALAKWAVERMAAPGYRPPPPLPPISHRGGPATRPDAYPDVTPRAAGEFMKLQLAENLSDRGQLENCYYYQGSDFRGGFGIGYVLSYMSQMGGWGVLDYALHDDPHPADLVRLGYASTLSSWALVNSGTPASNYGYWFPGKENDGSAGGGFEPRPFAQQWIGKVVPRGSWYYANEIDLGFSGALRSAATVVIDDPVFGPTAYGGELTPTPDGYAVVPHDGLRQRLHVLLGDRRLHLELTRDAFAADRPILIDRQGTRVRFTLEGRTGPSRGTTLRLSGGRPDVRLDGLPMAATPDVAGGATVNLVTPLLGQPHTVDVYVR